MVCSVLRFCFFKQKTAYELRISDWSSDVCSSDLIPAIQHFNGSDFSVVLPLSRSLSTLVDGFAPDIIHSHHPFLLGGTALRLARGRNLPLVFTHHTKIGRAHV